MLLFPGNKNKTTQQIITQLLTENYNQYYRLAYSYTHNEEDSKDIVQTGAYKALRNYHTLNNTEFAKTWLYRIMLNECFSFIRQPQHLSYDKMLDEDGIEWGTTQDTYADIDLQRAIEQLPDRDRAIVILKYFEDKTLEEIAEILDENISTVKSRLYRCMKKLRDYLEGDSGQATKKE